MKKANLIMAIGLFIFIVFIVAWMVSGIVPTSTDEGMINLLNQNHPELMGE